MLLNMPTSHGFSSSSLTNVAVDSILFIYSEINISFITLLHFSSIYHSHLIRYFWIPDHDAVDRLQDRVYHQVAAMCKWIIPAKSGRALSLIVEIWIDVSHLTLCVPGWKFRPIFQGMFRNFEIVSSISKSFLA
jgi:hypothetical protein